MKLQYVWEEKDVYAGQRTKFLDVEFIIGYKVAHGGKRFHLIDLRDGAIFQSKTKKQMADDLTENKHEPADGKVTE